MTGPGRPTDHVARTLRHYREAQRLTYKEISQRLAELGQPIPTLGLSRIEKGERRVDVDEIIALARVFGVPPLAFLFPVGRDEATELLPGRRVDPWTAAKWFIGEAALDAEMPSAEALAIEQFREHDRLVDEVARVGVDLDLLDDGLERRQLERRRKVAVRDLEALRVEMGRRGLLVPVAAGVGSA